MVGSVRVLMHQLVQRGTGRHRIQQQDNSHQQSGDERPALRLEMMRYKLQMICKISKKRGRRKIFWLEYHIFASASSKWLPITSRIPANNSQPHQANDLALASFNFAPCSLVFKSN